MISNGIDIEHVDRFLDREDDFYTEIFTQAEIAYCRSKSWPQQHFCGIYCAKEALSKALSGVAKNLTYRDLEVAHDANGRPYFVQTDVLSTMNISLSISHTKDTAVASVFIAL